jgi:hypothetical protein
MDHTKLTELKAKLARIEQLRDEIDDAYADPNSDYNTDHAQDEQEGLVDEILNAIKEA